MAYRSPVPGDLISRIRYQPEIDGLRALAVVPVLLFHLELSWAANGFLGVDVFFVISGYLIASIALAEVQAGQFLLERFWSRRVRRIIPLTALVVTATCAATAFTMFGPARHDVGMQALASLASVANIYFWNAAGDYWGVAADRSPLLHMWSLAVEEQFYLGFPLVAAAVFRLPRWLAATLVALLVAVSLGAYAALATTRPAACFYLVPTRAWELGLGVLLALVPKDSLMASGRRIALPIGVMVMLAAYCAPAEIGRAPGFLVVPVIAAGFALFGLGGPAGGCGWTGVVLRSALMVRIGIMSFSLYLWHWPIFVLLRNLNYPLDEPMVAAMAMAVTTLISLASHELVERRVRVAKSGVAIAVAMSVVAALGACALIATSGPPVLTGARATWFGNLYAVGSQPDPSQPSRTFIGVLMHPRLEEEPAPVVSEGVCGGLPGAPERVIVMGDSHALMWSNQISEACERLGVAARFWCADGTSPFTHIPPTAGLGSPGLRADERLAFDSARLASLERSSPGVLVLAARWSAVSNLDAGPAFVQHARSLGWRVLVIAQPPELWFGDLGALEYLATENWMPNSSPELLAEVSVRWRRSGEALTAVAGLVEGKPGCRLMTVDDLLAVDGGTRVRLAEGDCSRYVDDDHLSEEGTQLFADRIESSLLELLSEEPAIVR